MRRTLAALCLAALLAGSALRTRAETILDFAFYNYDAVPFDPFTVSRPLPSGLAPFLTFSIPASHHDLACHRIPHARPKKSRSG